MIKAWAGRKQVMQSLRQEVAILDCYPNILIGGFYS